MNTFKKNLLKLSIMGLGTLMFVGGSALFNAYGFSSGVKVEIKQQMNHNDNPSAKYIGDQEVDGFYFISGSTSPEHASIWNQLQEREQKQDPQVAMIDLEDEPSKQTRFIQTKQFSPCLHIANLGKTNIKATLFKGNEIVKVYVLTPEQLIATNPEKGNGKYCLKIESEDNGLCKAKGAVTAGDVTWY